MKKRVITGIFYVIIMLGVLAMKLFIPDLTLGNGVALEFGSLGVDIIFWLISTAGSYEFLRAVKDVSPAQRWTAMITCALIIPSFVVTKLVSLVVTGDPWKAGAFALIVLLAVTSFGAIITGSLTVFDHDRSDIKSTALALMCILYCGALGSVGANINHLVNNSAPAIVLLIFTCPAVDTFAFFFGKLFGRLLPAKLAPHTSPNKTVIGGAGGIIGGLFAAVLVWIMCEFLPDWIITLDYTGAIPKLVLLMIVAVPTAVAAQLGDLFESAIKRGCGIKDMGNLLPGHGGVLDRFDSMLFASVSIVVSFMII